MKIIFTSFFTTLTIGLMTFAPPLLAVTPDGQTPAVEPVCDVLQSGTPGLYGLCIAYCEAQDLNDINFDDLENSMKSAPHRKILENYRKKMQPGDMDMPCLATPCPCWEAEDLLYVDGSNLFEAISCKDVSIQPAFSSEYYLLTQPDPDSDLEGFSAGTSDSAGYCGTNVGENPGIKNTTIDEAQACKIQIATRCDEIGYPIP